MAAKNRIQYLDGLRGIACIIVVLFHSYLFFYPGWIWQLYALSQQSVAIFFILSGFVLWDWAKKSSVPFLCAARIVRLVPPSIIVISLSFAVSNIFPETTAGKAIGAPPSSLIPSIASIMLGTYGSGPWRLPSFMDVPTFCGQLWTIHYELLGSAIVIFVVKIKNYVRVAVFVLLLFFFGFGPLGLFAIGAFLAHKFKLQNEALALTMFIIYILLYFIDPRVGYLSLLGGIAFIHSQNSQSWLSGLMALCVFLSVFMSLTAHRVLSHPIINEIGRLSFPIYLVHMPVMAVIGSYLYRHGCGADIIFFICLISTTCIAYLFSIYIDQPFIKASRAVTTWRTAIPTVAMPPE